MEFVLPPFPDVMEMSGGDAPTEAEVIEWLAAADSTVTVGDEIIEVALDKANIVIPAPAAGVLRHGAAPGDVVSPGDVLGVIEEG
jgi:pyruvate/2-oxoglutarate dehydrogenase complex dihydrolipoamide acyltransferase (E2) component